MVPVLRIRDVYPGSRIQIFSIPDPRSRIEFFPSRYRICIKELKYFIHIVSKLSKYDPGSSSRIRTRIFYPSRIPDPGSATRYGKYLTKYYCQLDSIRPRIRLPCRSPLHFLFCRCFPPDLAGPRWRRL